MAILSPSILAADPMNMQKDLENAAQYLSIHTPKTTLAHLRAQTP